MPAIQSIKSSGKLRTFLNMQDLEKFTTHRPSSLKDLITIYTTKQQRNSRNEKSKIHKTDYVFNLLCVVFI